MSDTSTSNTNTISVARKRVDFERVIFVPLYAFMCATNTVLSLIGSAYVIIPVLLLLFAISRKPPAPGLLVVYALYNVLIASASYFDLMPTSWQSVFLAQAIPRQLVPIFSFFCCVIASEAYFRSRFSAGNVLRDATLFLVLYLFVSPLLSLASGISVFDTYNGFASFTNSTTVVFTFFAHWLFVDRLDGKKQISLAAFLLSAATTHFIQFKVFALMTASLLFRIVSPRIVVSTFLIGFVSIYLLLQFFISDVYKINPNSAIRLLFMRGAIESTWDTYGIGVGYGKESVRWVYDFDGTDESNSFLTPIEELDEEGLIKALATGVHNSFFQAMMRGGVIGLLLLVTFFVRSIPKGIGSSSRTAAPMLVFGMAVLACFVNPALESPLQLGGIAFALGYVRAFKLERNP